MTTKDYPPPPKPEGKIEFPARPYELAWVSSQDAYSESQMRAYVDADRALREQAQPILWASYYGDRLGNVYKTPELAAEYRAYNGLEMPRVVPLYAAPQAQPERKPMTALDRDALLSVIRVADGDAAVMISEGKAGGQLAEGNRIMRGIEIIRNFLKEPAP